jgi:hypothetical protein
MSDSIVLRARRKGLWLRRRARAKFPQLATLRRGVTSVTVGSTQGLLTACHEGSEVAGVDPANIAWVFCVGGSTWLSNMMGEPSEQTIWREPRVGRGRARSRGRQVAFAPLPRYPVWRGRQTQGQRGRHDLEAQGRPLGGALPRPDRRSARPSTRSRTPGRPRCSPSRSRKGTATARSRSSRASPAMTLRRYALPDMQEIAAGATERYAF